MPRERGLVLGVAIAVASAIAVFLIAPAGAQERPVAREKISNVHVGPRFTALFGRADLGDGSNLGLFISKDQKDDHQGSRIQLTFTRKQTRSREMVFTLSLNRLRLRANSVQGRLGDSGRIDLTFHPTGRRVIEPDRNCGTDVERTFRAGTLTGSLRFRDEDFIDVDLRRMKAGRLRGTAVSCTVTSHTRAQRTEAKLTACGRGEDAWQVQRLVGGETRLTATSRLARRDGFYSQSYIERRIRPGTFVPDLEQNTATLHPPSPFTGTGTYADGEVSGDLRWRSMNGIVTPMRSDDATLRGSNRGGCVIFGRSQARNDALAPAGLRPSALLQP